jgi:hypothetical protein
MLRNERATYVIDATEALRVDSRPPILYLRSFQDDQLRLRAPAVDGRSSIESWHRAGVEEIVVNRLWRFGPVVAVGRPREQFPPAGAVRDYLLGEAAKGEEDWQERVAEWMAISGLIVVVLGRTEGLAWEVAKLVALDQWSRVVLVLPPVRPKDLRARWNSFRTVVAQAGGPLLPAEVELARALAVLEYGGRIHLITSERRDYVAYQVMAEAAAALILGDARLRPLSPRLKHYRSPIPARDFRERW